jgi:cyclopropane fatty-acyl-phospholipid synthase-like methyltransferase
MTSMSVPVWDEWNRQGAPKYPHEKVIQFCFRNYPPAARKETRVLDLGCGSGVHTVFLASEGFDVTGIDISSVGVENARRKLDAKRLRAELRVEAADVLRFPPASFDLVVCVGVYDGTGPDIARASVNRLTEVLAEGARGLFLFASDRDFRVRGEQAGVLYGYTRSEVEEIFVGRFPEVWIDRYITTHEGGRIEQNDWLVTVKK